MTCVCLGVLRRVDVVADQQATTRRGALLAAEFASGAGLHGQLSLQGSVGACGGARAVEKHKGFVDRRGDFNMRCSNCEI